MYTVYGVGFWYGVKLIFDDIERCRGEWVCSNEYTPENLVIIFFSVLLGGFQIGQSAPYAEALSQGSSRREGCSCSQGLGIAPRVLE